MQLYSEHSGEECYDWLHDPQGSALIRCTPFICTSYWPTFDAVFSV